MTAFEIAISLLATVSTIFYGTLAIVSMLKNGKGEDQ